MLFIPFLVWICLGWNLKAFALMGCRAKQEKSAFAANRNSGMKIPSDYKIRRDNITNTITYLKGDLTRELGENKDFELLRIDGSKEEIALAFISAYRSDFHLTDPRNELVVKKAETDDRGIHHLQFQQVYEGVPIRAAEINVHIKDENRVYLIQGRYIPTPENLDINPEIDLKRACAIVSDYLNLSKAPDCKEERIIYVDSSKKPHLCYRIVAVSSPMKGWEVFVDANTGDIIEKLPVIRTQGIDADG